MDTAQQSLLQNEIKPSKTIRTRRRLKRKPGLATLTGDENPNASVPISFSRFQQIFWLIFGGVRGGFYGCLQQVFAAILEVVLTEERSYFQACFDVF